MEITFISDTHCAEPELPGGDLLIHAGDLTFRGRTKETKAYFGVPPIEPMSETLISIAFFPTCSGVKYLKEKWSPSTIVSVVISNSFFPDLITAVSSPMPTKTFLSFTFW